MKKYYATDKNHPREIPVKKDPGETTPTKDEHLKQPTNPNRNNPRNPQEDL